MWDPKTGFDQRRDATGPRRLEAGQPPSAQSGPWRAGDSFSQADADPDLTRFAEDALSRHGLAVTGQLILVRHRAGDRGLPAEAAEGEIGFAIDLTDARRTMDGGLLLFVQPDGRLAGWRAERGMMTIWSGDGPELTELAPGAPDRLTLVGRAGAV